MLNNVVLRLVTASKIEALALTNPSSTNFLRYSFSGLLCNWFKNSQIQIYEDHWEFWIQQNGMSLMMIMLMITRNSQFQKFEDQRWLKLILIHRGRSDWFKNFENRVWWWTNAYTGISRSDGEDLLRDMSRINNDTVFISGGVNVSPKLSFIWKREFKFLKRVIEERSWTTRDQQYKCDRSNTNPNEAASRDSVLKLIHTPFDFFFPRKCFPGKIEREKRKEWRLSLQWRNEKAPREGTFTKFVLWLINGEFWKCDYVWNFTVNYITNFCTATFHGSFNLYCVFKIRFIYNG